MAEGDVLRICGKLFFCPQFVLIPDVTKRIPVQESTLVYTWSSYCQAYSAAETIAPLGTWVPLENVKSLVLRVIVTVKDRKVRVTFNQCSRRM
jgi:hypothetical protein